MLRVEFPQVQYTSLSEIAYVLSVVAIVTSVHLNLSTSGWSLFDHEC